MNLLFLNVALAVAWAAITASFTGINLIVGFALGAFAIWLVKDLWEGPKYFRRVWLILSLAFLFTKELWKSSINVAIEVLKPRPTFEPGIIAVPLTVDRDYEITLLANLITLTPGTLSVDISTDRTTLYVHAIHIGDSEEFIRDIKEGFERQILETLR